MNMPGFTAETSLLNSDMRYQATTVATIYGGVVQPALSDVFNPHDYSLYQFGRFNCLKRVCSFGLDVFGLPMYECRWVGAIC
jgi:hypothetical protein